MSASDRALFLRATELIPTDGIVKETSRQIVEGAANDLDKARLIYDWVVANTVRDPRTRGCGPGDIGAMLRTGELSGKCADINALFVGLARAAGLPARDLYGLRIAPSQFGLKSSGASSEIVTKAGSDCRAEVFLTGFGWTPVDPATCASSCWRRSWADCLPAIQVLPSSERNYSERGKAIGSPIIARMIWRCLALSEQGWAS